MNINKIYTFGYQTYLNEKNNFLDIINIKGGSSHFFAFTRNNFYLF
jgi:hypothetical protein